jgi:hypothetical protein
MSLSPAGQAYPCAKIIRLKQPVRCVTPAPLMRHSRTGSHREWAVPVKYTISTKEMLVHVNATGVVAREDMDELRARLLSDPGIRRGMHLILESSKVDSRLNFSDLQVIAGRLNGIFERGINKVAVVADSRYAYSLAKTFAVFAANQPVRMKPFRNREAALVWLKTDAEPAEETADIEPQSVVERDNSLVEVTHRRRTPWAAIRALKKQ